MPQCPDKNRDDDRIGKIQHHLQPVRLQESLPAFIEELSLIVREAANQVGHLSQTAEFAGYGEFCKNWEQAKSQGGSSKKIDTFQIKKAFEKKYHSTHGEGTMFNYFRYYDFRRETDEFQRVLTGQVREDFIEDVLEYIRTNFYDHLKKFAIHPEIPEHLDDEVKIRALPVETMDQSALGLLPWETESELLVYLNLFRFEKFQSDSRIFRKFFDENLPEILTTLSSSDVDPEVRKSIMRGKYTSYYNEFVFHAWGYIRVHIAHILQQRYGKQYRDIFDLCRAQRKEIFDARNAEEKREERKRSLQFLGVMAVGIAATLKSCGVFSCGTEAEKPSIHSIPPSGTGSVNSSSNAPSTSSSVPLSSPAQSSLNPAGKSSLKPYKKY